MKDQIVLSVKAKCINYRSTIINGASVNFVFVRREHVFYQFILSFRKKCGYVSRILVCIWNISEM